MKVFFLTLWGNYQCWRDTDFLLHKTDRRDCSTCGRIVGNVCCVLLWPRSAVELGVSGKRRNPNYCLSFLPALGQRGPYTPRRHCAIQDRSTGKGSRGSRLDSTSWDLNSLTLSFPICKVGIIIAGYILLKWFKDFHELFFSGCSPTQSTLDCKIH